MRYTDEPDGEDAGTRRRDGRARKDAERQLRRGDRRGHGSDRQGERGRGSDGRREAQVLHQVCDGDGGHDVGGRGGRGGGDRRAAARAAQARGPAARVRHAEGLRRLRHGLPHADLLAEGQQGRLHPHIGLPREQLPYYLYY